MAGSGVGTPVVSSLSTLSTLSTAGLGLGFSSGTAYAVLGRPATRRCLAQISRAKVLIATKDQVTPRLPFSLAVFMKSLNPHNPPRLERHWLDRHPARERLDVDP